jgi:hypothetical protein
MNRLIKTTTKSFTRTRLLAMLTVFAAIFIFTGCSDDQIMAPQTIDQQQAQGESIGSSNILMDDGDKIQIVPVHPHRDYTKDSDLNGSATPQLDAAGNVIGWDVAIAGVHYESRVNYSGNIVGGQFTPAMPGLGWLHDDAELMPAYEPAFVAFSNHPYALTHQGVAGGVIDAPLGNTTWGKLLTQGPKNLDFSKFASTDFDRSAFDNDESSRETTSRTLHVMIHDPATGKVLTDKEATHLLVSRGLPVDRVGAFLMGEATADDIAFMADKDGIQVTVSASVEITVKVPPFVEVKVTGSVSLTGDMDDYAEMATKAREMARELANDLADEVKEALVKLKQLVKWIIEEIDEMIEGAWWWPF